MRDTGSRRRFLGTAATAAAGAGAFLAAGRFLRAQGANERLRLGVVGCGPQGHAHVERFLRVGAEVVAVADVDRNRADEAAAQVDKAGGRRSAVYQDYRRLLELKDVDAISIATADHWHALVMIHACQAGKDVYCEKPISHNIVEGRAMVKAARRYGRVVQVGTQQRSALHFQEAVRLVRAGELGRIVETQTWTCERRPRLPHAPDGAPPAFVNYDLWLGPAPQRPFNPNRFHYNWHWFWDYGGNNMTNWNVHLQDIVHLAMDAWSPRSAAMAGFMANEGDFRDTPDTGTAVFEYDTPQGPFTQTYTMRWDHGYPPGGRPEKAQHGILFCGRKATLFVDRGGWRLTPEKGEGEPREAKGADSLENHFRNFLECVKTRGTPASDIESMHKTSAACHLANIAYRVGRRVYWDAQNEKCFRDKDLKVPDEAANALLGREYRKPWSLPDA